MIIIPIILQSVSGISKIERLKSLVDVYNLFLSFTCDLE